MLWNQKERTCPLEDHWVKTKESNIINKYLNLAREMKMLWDTMVALITAVIGEQSLKKFF